jgi:hypothetical protein
VSKPRARRPIRGALRQTPPPPPFVNGNGHRDEPEPRRRGGAWMTLSLETIFAEALRLIDEDAPAVRDVVQGDVERVREVVAGLLAEEQRLRLGDRAGMVRRLPPGRDESD